MRFQIQHHTEYFYDETVGFTPQWLRLHPRLDPWLLIKSYHLQVFPSGTIHWTRDADGNAAAKFFTMEQSRQLCVNVEMEIENTQESPFDFLLDTHAVTLPFEYSPVERQVLSTFLKSPSNSTLRDWIQECSLEASGETVTFLTHASQFLHRAIQYQIRDEPGIQTPEETVEKKSGSCRDYAVLFNSLCGFWGLAARFVSGYLCSSQHDPEHEQGAHALHAWSEVYLPGAGWKGIDPTNGVWCGNHYVPLAASVEPAETAAITGTYCSHHPVQARMTSSLCIKNATAK
ncbi:MAG: transglutaminase domain-containing protein [Candidatus Methylacidiphilales bacterium]